MTRSKRLVSGVVIGAGATALTGTMLFTGVSDAHEGNVQGTGGAVAPATTPTTLADSAQRTLVAGDAGTVTVQRTGDVLTVVATAPMTGWTTTVKKATGHTVKVAFTSATSRVLVRAHLTDEGRFRYSVMEKRDHEAERIAFFKGVAAKADADKVAANQAAADKAAADTSAGQKAAATRADDGHDGTCDHDGFRGTDAEKADDHGGDFRQAGFDDHGTDDHEHDGGRRSRR